MVYSVHFFCFSFCELQLCETVYRKGKDELMWVILQYVAVYIDRVSNEEMVRVAEIYNLLYRFVE